MIYFICSVLIFSFALATESADAWSDWSKWLKQSGGSNTQQPYWQNYGNWKEWASKASGGGGNRSKYGTSGGGGGSPWSDTPYGGGNVPEPSKESFDDWRKWNLKQEKTYGDDWKSYGRWQSWVENQKKKGDHPDDSADFGDWQKWMNQGGGQGGGAGGWEKWANPMNAAAAEPTDAVSEKAADDLDESFEQWIRKRSASKIDAEHDISEETRHGRKSKEDKTTAHIETTDETETRGQGSHGSQDSHGKSKKSKDSASNEAGNYKDYIPNAFRSYGGGKEGADSWSKYAGGGADSWNKYAGGGADSWNKYAGGGADSWKDYSKDYAGGGADSWKKYADGGGADSWKNFIPGSYGAEAGGAGGSYGAGSYGTPQTLVSKPKPRSDDSNSNSEENVDWRKYVPEAYRGNIPSDSVIKAEREKELAQNQDHGSQPPKAMTTIAPTKEQVTSTYSFSLFNLALVTVAVCLALAACVWNQYKKRFEYEPLDDLDRLMLI